MEKKDVGLTFIGLTIFAAFIVLGLWGCPQYKVYEQRKEGEAMLAHAQSSREVAVAEAKAKFEAATLLAAADTLRAHGIANSITIIGKQLDQQGENYLKWLWVDKLDLGTSNIIYVPMNGILPVTEAGRAIKKVDDSSAK